MAFDLRGDGGKGKMRVIKAVCPLAHIQGSTHNPCPNVDGFGRSCLKTSALVA